MTGIWIQAILEVGVIAAFGNCRATWDIEGDIAFVKSSMTFEEIVSVSAGIRLLSFVNHNCY